MKPDRLTITSSGQPEEAGHCCVSGFAEATNAAVCTRITVAEIAMISRSRSLE